jgi:hypothetical protein
MKEEHIKRIGEILVQWDPLGEKAAQIRDFDNYHTEAEDILFNIEIELDLANSGEIKKITRKIVREVLNEAYHLRLSEKDCENASELIYRVLI